MTTYDYGTREAGPPPTPDAAARPGQRAPGGSRLARAWRGRPEDPRWARPALWALLAATTVLYLWSLGASGYANQFYSAAVQAGGESWKAFFFGSSDAANSITVDKPPAALWPMALSVRLFGLSSWAVLAPEALMGVATVGVLYAAVRRRFGAAAGLIAGAALAVTPVAALMFRFNNPDALLCLLMVSAVSCVLRALEDARTKWLLLAGVCFGLGFLTKTLQAWLILPPLAVVYAVCAPAKFGRRIGQLLLAGLAMVVSGGWWVAIVELWPASSRPYIGGSQHNSFLELTFGYNGLGRINGNETGSVGGGGPGGPGGGGGGGGRWGETGIDRLFGSDMGGQIAWLLPAAFILLAAGIWLTWRAKRTDTRRAAFLVWGGSLLMTFATFSFMSGIFHQYYNIALAPYIAALVGMGAAVLWERRSEGGRAGAVASAVLAVTVAVTAYMSYVLLGRSPDWHPWLRWAVLIGGLAAAAGLLLTARLGRRAALAAAGLGLAAGLAGPVAYTLNTVETPKHGSIVTAGPSVAGGMGGPGGRFPGGGRGGPPGMQNGRQGAGQQGQGQGQGNQQGGQGQQGQGQGGPQGAPGGGTGGGTGGGQPGGGQNGFPGGGFPGGGQSPRNGTGNAQGGQGQNGRPGMLPGGGMGEGGRRGGGMGGLLDGQQVDAEVEAKLAKNADDYTWAAAAIGSQNAASYQLATEKPVMAIGGFNGSDPSPTLAQFKEYVKQGRIHYFISSGTGMGGGPGGGQGTSSQITSWIEATYKKVTVGSSTLYDLTQKATKTAKSSD
ncbi:glycosyltransferase family 39 protein [Streptomyces sp. DASNCL29]|uniref:glycosyltransferase family 39 protein n=1 Tax=Streptomyces sp. DASNCL29 TaxID=2583819 RepID=UPI00110FE0DB|nr:glycosyltransferase family 39 protein [Streptomyces sp. DASNCL29]TMU93714.1 glycosyl transferase [Streptomyces sp. DASNCL29]